MLAANLVVYFRKGKYTTSFYVRETFFDSLERIGEFALSVTPNSDEFFRSLVPAFTHHLHI